MVWQPMVTKVGKSRRLARGSSATRMFGLAVTALLLSACITVNVTAPAPTVLPVVATQTGPEATRTTPPATAEPTAVPEVEVEVYFTDSNRYATGTPPFEVAVQRTVPETARLPEAVLLEFFKGPTEAERAQGLEAITSGFTGFRELELEEGIARVYLEGQCTSLGATYTVAQPILANLLQFPEIRYVKIYDSDGVTEVPEGESNSIPFCLEP